MILKLTQVPDQAQDFKSGLTLLVNLDQVAAIHAAKLTIKTPIIGGVNEHWGAVITLATGKVFPILQTAEEIYEMLPYPLKRVSWERVERGAIV